MIELWLNNSQCDTDDKTIIGFEWQVYDFKDPARPKVKVSNNFTIPATSKNKLIIGIAGNSHVDTTTVYDKFIVKYIVDNEIIIEDARARVEKVSDRIELFIYQKNDVWDTFKNTKLSDITNDLINYLAPLYNYPTVTSKFTGSYSDYVDIFLEKRGLYLTYYFGNLASYQNSESEPFYETPDTITLHDSYKQGGHLSLFMIDFFRFLESKYNVDFQVDTIFDGNIFQDQYISKIYVPFQHICFDRQVDAYYIRANSASDTWNPHTEIPKQDKTIYDLITSFFKHFNVLMDYIWLEGQFVTRLYRFDDIKTLAPVIDWSGSLKGDATFIPRMEGWAQKTKIKFTDIYEGGSEDLNLKIITVSNSNIDPEATITEIKAYINPFTNYSVPLLNEATSLKEFSFFIDSENTTNVTIYDDSDSVSKTLVKPNLYSLSGEYVFLAEIMQRPKVYEIERWMKTSDIRNLLFFAEYFVEELGGSFFIHKISGFNPAKKNTTAKVQLVKTSNRTPQIAIDINNWKDGLGNYFTDGLGNYFIYGQS